ncbi:MAG: hypothetical protein ACKO24_07510 [Leptolyngbyaceae cyanobacterium]
MICDSWTIHEDWFSRGKEDAWSNLDYSRTPQLLAVIPVQTGIQVGHLLPEWIPALYV